jgi:hypothetical protein
LTLKSVYTHCRTVYTRAGGYIYIYEGWRKREAVGGEPTASNGGREIGCRVPTRSLQSMA